MHALPATLAVGLLAITLSGCSSMPDREQVWSRSSAFFSQSAAVLKAQRKRLADFAGSLVSSRDDELRNHAIDTLFAQSYIDPLSEYLEQHSGDDRFAAQLARVAAERSQRCAAISRVYAKREASPDNLQRMRRGYMRSCPSEVRMFAARSEYRGTTEISAPTLTRAAQAKAAESADVAAVPTRNKIDPELAEALSRRQRSDCYLLFTIRNNTQALDACQPLAAAGDAKAQHHMAQLALTRNDLTAAADWATRSATQQHPPGLMLLAQLYQRGRGVSSDPTHAHKLMQSAANQGLAEAAYYTGLNYQSGNGVSAEPVRAARYLEQAADNGHIPAYLALARLHENTQAERSRYWLDQAARKGSAQAQYLLGESFARGTLGPTDNQEAYVWYSLARLNGQAEAKAGIDQQEKLLTASQLAAARSRVQDGINGRWD